MGENDRLLGKLEKFMENTEGNLVDIKAQLEDLKSFKWKVLGGSAVLSTLISGLAVVIGWVLK